MGLISKVKHLYFRYTLEIVPIYMLTNAETWILSKFHPFSSFRTSIPGFLSLSRYLFFRYFFESAQLIMFQTS